MRTACPWKNLALVLVAFLPLLTYLFLPLLIHLVLGWLRLAAIGSSPPPVHCGSFAPEEIATVAVTLMVKDEAPVLERTLSPYVEAGFTTYLIYDTGSTDGTVTLAVSFFRARNITTYCVVEDTFVDFSTSRNRALRAAEALFPASSFLLMPDAEWQLYNGGALLHFADHHRTDTETAYLVKSNTGSLSYFSARLIRAHVGVKYVGVVHEVLDRIATVQVPGAYFIHHGTAFGVEKSTARWHRDKRLLLREVERNPEDRRSLFYLAQTYDCLGEFREAFEWYRIRANLTGWVEEDFLTRYRAGQAALRFGEPELGLVWLLKAAAFRPTRAEPLVRAAEYYLEQKDYQMAFLLAQRSLPISLPADILFVEPELYSFRRYEILSIAGWYVGKYEEGEAATRKCLEVQPDAAHLQRNLQFYEDRRASLEEPLPVTSRSIVIVTYAVEGMPAWDPESVTDGIPGSEEAVIYLAAELAALNYTVVVYGNPPPTSIHSAPDSNPRYVPMGSTGSDFPARYAYAVSWRQPALGSALRKLAPTVILWPHDTLHASVETVDFDGIMWLSQWQRQQWVGVDPRYSRHLPIFGNGVVPTAGRLAKPNPYSCIYASNYGRGLLVLINIWPAVREAFPRATLDIYYGWQHWGLLSVESEAWLRGRIQELASEGVREHGRVSHAELTAAYERTSIWTYPCTAAETFCISALRAQLAGCLPVIVRGSALEETVFAGYSTSDSTLYLEELLAAMGNIDQITPAYREELRRRVLDSFTWAQVAQKWDAHLQAL